MKEKFSDARDTIRDSYTHPMGVAAEGQRNRAR